MGACIYYWFTCVQYMLVSQYAIEVCRPMCLQPDMLQVPQSVAFYCASVSFLLINLSVSSVSFLLINLSVFQSSVRYPLQVLYLAYKSASKRKIFTLSRLIFRLNAAFVFLLSSSTVFQYSLSSILVPDLLPSPQIAAAHKLAPLHATHLPRLSEGRPQAAGHEPW